MYALVEDNNITKIITNPKSIVIERCKINYNSNIFFMVKQN